MEKEGKMRKITHLLGILSLTVILFSPNVSNATPILFSLSGNVFDAQNNQINLWGNMIVDNQLTHIVPDPSQSWYQTYYFPIVQFAIYSDLFEFAGNNGALWFDGSIVINGQHYLADAIDSLSGFINGTNYSWIGEEFTFFNADGTPYDRTVDQYSFLPSVFNMEGPVYQSPIPGESLGNEHSAGLIYAHQVPEPSTLLLFCCGLCLAGLLILRRRLARWLK